MPMSRGVGRIFWARRIAIKILLAARGTLSPETSCSEKDASSGRRPSEEEWLGGWPCFDRPVGRLAGVRGPKSGQRPPCVFVSAARVMKLSQFHDV